jgi:hypothetical protein
MKFSVSNFLTHVKTMVMGGGRRPDGTAFLDAGYLKDVSVPPNAVATTGTRATAENAVPADVIVLDAAGEDALVNFTVPRDYDEATDHLKVILLVSYVSGTSIPVGASAASLGRPGSAVAAKSGFVAPSATTIASGSDCVEIEADLSQLLSLRHDNLTVNFAAGTAVGSGVAHVIGARVEYRTTLVSYNEKDASGNPLR